MDTKKRFNKIWQPFLTPKCSKPRLGGAGRILAPMISSPYYFPTDVSPYMTTGLCRCPLGY